MEFRDLINRFVGFLSSNAYGKKARATREWFALDEETRKKLGPELTGRGYEIPTYSEKSKQKQRQVMIEYSYEEWGQLAENAWEVRKNDPTLSFSDLVKKAQTCLPKERRKKNIRPASYRVLIGLLQTRDEKLVEAATAAKAPPPPPTIIQKPLEELSEAELRTLIPRVMPLIDVEDYLQSFSPNQVFDMYPLPMLLTYLFGKGMEAWQHHQAGNNHTAKAILNCLQSIAAKDSPNGTAMNIKPVLPKVMVVGLLNDQKNHVYNSLSKRCNISFVDKERTANLPVSDKDVVVLMADFISHAIQNQVKGRITNGTKLVLHHGGVSKLIERIGGMLA